MIHYIYQEYCDRTIDEIFIFSQFYIYEILLLIASKYWGMIYLYFNLIAIIPSLPDTKTKLVDLREAGDIRLFITLVPKVLLEWILIRWLNNFGDFY